MVQYLSVRAGVLSLLQKRFGSTVCTQKNSKVNWAMTLDCVLEMLYCVRKMLDCILEMVSAILAGHAAAADLGAAGVVVL